MLDGARYLACDVSPALLAGRRVVKSLSALSAVLLLLLSAVVARTQEPSPLPEPSVPDSASAEPYAGHHHIGWLYLVIPAMLIAPSGLLFLEDSEVNLAGDTLAFWRARVRLRMGVMAETASRPGDEDVEGWGPVVIAETWSRGVYAEARVQHISFPSPVFVGALRAGYFVRASETLGGGLTFGYRHASGEFARRGAEIGFPLVFSDRGLAMYWDVAYVIDSREASWNGRGRLEWTLRRAPFQIGVEAGQSESLSSRGGLSIVSYGLTLTHRR